MENLTLNDIQQLNHSIQKLYNLHHIATFGLDAIRIIEQLVPSKVPLFHLITIRPRHVDSNWAQLVEADMTLVGFTLDRPQQSVTERDRLILNLLKPHLLQAYCNAQKHDRLQRNRRQFGVSVNPVAIAERNTSILDSLHLLELSQRETDVLGLVMQGKENKIIAAQLRISESTVRKHLESIYSKLGVKSRTEAIAHTLQKLGFL
jgi:ATP/maltotriose-dependent transcriptional regulator MalT